MPPISSSRRWIRPPAVCIWAKSVTWSCRIREETIHADLLLHVVDAASPVRNEQIEQVNAVLTEIGADHVPQVLVWNKIDLAGLPPTIERDEYDKICRVFASAHSGEGVDLLRQAIAEFAQAAGGDSVRHPRDDAGIDAAELASGSRL